MEDVVKYQKEEGAQVETVDVNESMSEEAKKGFSFSFGIGYTINGRRNDIFAVEISTT